MRLPEVTDRVRDVPVKALRLVFAGIGQLLLVVDRLRDDQREAGLPAASPGYAPAVSRERDAASVSVTPGKAHVRTVPPAESPASAEATDAQATAPKATDAKAPAPKATDAKATAAKATDAKAPAAKARASKAGARQAGAQGAGTKARGTAAATRSAKSSKQSRAQAARAKPGGQGQPEADRSRFRSLDTTGNVRVLTAEDLTAPEPPPPPAPAVDLPVPGYDELTIASLRARLRNLDAAQVRTLLDYEQAHAGRADIVTMFERRIAKLHSEPS